MLRKAVFLLCLGLMLPSFVVVAAQIQTHPITSLLGEKLEYDISFLWFDHLAEGSISLIRGEEDGTYLVTMEAKTLGVAAFFTRNRVEKFQTLMRIGNDGLLQPLWHSSHTLRDKENGSSEKYRATSLIMKTSRFDTRSPKIIVPIKTSGLSWSPIISYLIF